MQFSFRSERRSNNSATHRNWRLLNHSSEDGAVNLAIDEAILRGLLGGHSFQTLRLWRNPPTVVVGRFQDIRATVNVSMCRQLGVPVLRRVSGGGTVYQDYGNLNYSVIIHKSSFNGELENVEKSYDVLCGGITEGLRELGVNAYTHKGNIIIGGKKVSGSTQHRLYDVILHHGTLLVTADLNVLGNVLGETDIEERLTNLQDIIPHRMSINQVKKAIIDGFEKKFDLKFMKGRLTRTEKDCAKKLYEMKYGKNEWNRGRKAIF